MGNTCSSEKSLGASTCSSDNASLQTVAEDPTLLEMGYCAQVARLYEVVEVFSEEECITLCKVYLQNDNVLESEKKSGRSDRSSSYRNRGIASIPIRKLFSAAPSRRPHLFQQIIADNPVLLLRWYHTIDLLKTLDHPNLPRLVDVHDEEHHSHENCVSFVMEFCDGGNLLERFPRYTECQARKIFRQMLDVVHYLHSLDIVHGDLRAQWFMFESSDPKDWKIKLMDFSIAQQQEQRHVGDTSSSSLRVLHDHEPCMYSTAPEALYGRSHTKSGDMWSLGVILYQLLSGKAPFAEQPAALMQNMRAQNGIPSFQEPEWNRISPLVKDLIKKLLHPLPKSRFTMGQALGHNWLISRY